MREPTFLVCRHLIRLPALIDVNDILKSLQSPLIHVHRNGEGDNDIFTVIERCHWERVAFERLTQLVIQNPNAVFNVFSELE